MQATSESIMIELKTATQPLHDQTEAGRFNKELVMGRIPLDAYVDMLGQFFLVHRALEAQLRRHLATSDILSAVIRDHQFQEPYLRADLAFFGRDPETEQPFPATAQFISYIDKLADSEPDGLLGIHYVFEGSNNGSKYISNALRRAYNLNNGDGTRYFDPYGDRQREIWQEFKQSAANITPSPKQRTRIVDAASETFLAVMRIHEALQSRLDAPSQSA